MVAPAPLVPAGVDLRSFDWFPFKHKQLRRSAWWLRASDRAKAIAIELWCASYEEVPAASLPDDDMALSDAVGFGRRDLSQWLAIKPEVMDAWVMCSDGRWYHPIMADVALEAWDAREARRKRERDKKAAQRGRAENVPGDNGTENSNENRGGAYGDENVPGDTSGTPQGKTSTGKERTGEERTGDEGGDGGKGVAPPAAPNTRGTRLPIDWKLSDDDTAYAIDKGIAPEDVDNLGEEFFTYWRGAAGQKGTKLDWPATWRNHVLKQIRWKKERGNGPGSGTDRGRAQHQERVGAMLEGALEAVNRVQGRRGQQLKS